MRAPRATLLDLSHMTPWPAEDERVSSAESEPSSSAWLERTWIIEARPIGVGAAAAHHGGDAEQRQVVALEDVGGFGHPLVRVAVELIDFLDMGDGIEEVLGEGVAGARTDEAVGQLRRQRHHVGDEVANRLLVEMRFRGGGEEHRVARFVEEPLEISKQRLRVAIDCGQRQIQHFGMIVRKTR